MRANERWRASALGLCAVVFGLCVACERSRIEEPELRSQNAAGQVFREKAAPAGASVATGGTEGSAPASQARAEYRLPAVERLVAIGDLHGDFEATRRIFRAAGATDDADRWAGGKLVVVQTGDQLDRGDGEREILDFLDRLEGEAKQGGGALHVLNGNHETMNVMGDFRYVTRGALHAFDDLKPRARGADRFPSEFRGRAAAFLPGGAVALRLARRPIILQVGDTVFAHAGVRAPHVDHGIDRLNEETRAWMRGDTPFPPRLLQDEEGPVWTRVYGSPDLDGAACQVLERSLSRLQAKRMVVGHSVQPGGVRAGCDGRVQRIDVGLSAYYGSGALEALEIRGDQVRVIATSR